MPTLYPGNEPEFYIPHDQLPDTCLVDVKFSPDNEYLIITGNNALTYIYRNRVYMDNTGFYKLDWEYQHKPMAKSVVTFLGFGKDGIRDKFIIFPGNDDKIYQYEIIKNTLKFWSSYDISDAQYEQIHWLFVYVKYDFCKSELKVFISGSREINKKDGRFPGYIVNVSNYGKPKAPLAEFHSTLSFPIKTLLFNNNPDKSMLKNVPMYTYYNTPNKYSQQLIQHENYVYMSRYQYEQDFDTYNLCVRSFNFNSGKNYGHLLHNKIDSTDWTLYYYKGKSDDLQYTNTEIQLGHATYKFLDDHEIQNITATKNKIFIRSLFMPDFTLFVTRKMCVSDDLYMAVLHHDNTLTYELIKKYNIIRHYQKEDWHPSRWKVQKQQNVNFIQFFTPNNKYIIVHEKIWDQPKTQLGFILNVRGKYKNKLKNKRINSMLTPYLPPELIDIVKKYL